MKDVNKRKYTSNTKEGWGLSGWARFDDLLKQEERNRKSYKERNIPKEERVTIFQYVVPSNTFVREEDVDINDESTYDRSEEHFESPLEGI